MARFTSLEFMEALGLGYFDYNGAKILLRCLTSKGIAKPVDKIRPAGGRGRSMVVYEIPDEITLRVTPPETMPCHPPKKKKQASTEEAAEEEKITVSEIVQQAAVAPPETVEYEWDDGWDDD
jgi:hypothetical protein